MTITVVFDHSDYIPLANVTFSPQTIAGVQCDGTGILDNFTGSADCAVSNSVCVGSGITEFSGTATCLISNPAVQITVSFNSANYTPLPVVVFGVLPTGLQCDGSGFIDLVGTASCHSTSHNVCDGVGVIECSGTAGVVSIVNIATGGGVLDDVTGSAACLYDINVKRYVTCEINATVQTAKALTRITLSSQQATQRHQQLINSTVQSAAHIDIDINCSINPSVLLSNDANIDQQNALSIVNTLSSVINLTQLLSLGITDNKQDAKGINTRLLSVQDWVRLLISQTQSSVKNCSDYVLHIIKSSYQTLINYVPRNEVSFTGTDYVPRHEVNFSNSILVELSEQITRGLAAEFHSSPAHSVLLQRKHCHRLQQAMQPMMGKSQRIDLPRPPAPPQPLNHKTTIIIIHESYAMHHTISVKILPANTDVELSKISLSYDVEAYAWSFSGVLANKADLSLFNMSSFDPVQLSITINGYHWIVLVEKVPEKKSFGNTEISLTGRSLSALLSDPWCRVSSYTAGSELTIQQIANSLIPYDWTIDWQCPTWLVPANTYSYTQQTTLQALKTLATNIGAALIPARDAKTLVIKPRYPILPWHYNESGINPDLIIPDAAIDAISLESRLQSPINGVYVHGEQNGVLAWCRLNGTAGDVLAPTESNALITDVIGARMLGERILASKFTQPTVTSVTTSLGGDFPLAEVGQLVEVAGERSIISGLSIEVTFGEVIQTITVGDQTNNVYAKLLNILPKQPLLVGNVAVTYDDKSILTLLDGGVITARGTGVVGQNYYVRNGVIESAAPNLTPNDIVI